MTDRDPEAHMPYRDTDISDCGHGMTVEKAIAIPPGCPVCLGVLEADLDELELNDPKVRDAAIRLQDVIEGRRR